MNYHTLGGRGRITRGRLGAAMIVALALSRPAHAQGFWEKLGQGLKQMSAASAEILLASATSIDLESRGLPTVQVGSAVFGIASVDVKDTSAIRVRAYLYNASAQDVRVPLITEGMLVLVDAKGRRIEALTPPRIERLAKGATEVAVPALERLRVTIVYGQTKSDAGTGSLKVGTYGVISGIPLSPAGASTMASGGSSGASTPYPSSSSTPYPTSTTWTTPSPSSPSSPSTPAPSPSSPTSPAPYSPAPAAPSQMPQPVAASQGGSAGSLAGDWNEPTLIGAIRIDANGGYTTPSGGVGRYTVDGSSVVFTGPLALLNQGRATLNNGQIEFRTAQSDGSQKVFTFTRK